MNLIVHNRFVLVITLLIFAFLLHLSNAAGQMSSTNYKIPKDVADQGGSASQSTSFKVIDAIGQPSPLGLDPAASTNYKEASGFFAKVISPNFPPWVFKTTSKNATIVLPVSANPNIDGVPLKNDDYVGVFTPAGLCCGYSQWKTGQNMSITAWGDDDLTIEVEGFKTGEIIKYRVFRASEAKEWTNVEVGYVPPADGMWKDNAMMVLNKFNVKEIIIPWSYKTTNNNATVVLPATANPNIDGTPLGNSDFVGVFTPAGLCCGYAQWQGQNLAITVWGDDDQTPATDGFKVGESIKYRVYQISTQRELTSVFVGYSQGGPGLYSVNGYLVLNKFDVFTDRTLTLSFDQGWNMFSINVNPRDPDIANVMSPIVSKITLVKDDQGKNYIPEYGINTIGNIDFKEGYQANLTQATLLDVKGQPVDPTTPISLLAGWSMISYLPTVPIEPERALATINDNLIIAKDGKGHQYIPEYGINTIGTMKEGQGYWVYLKAADVLVYPPNMGDMMMVNKVTGMEQISTQTEHFLVNLNSSENATVVIPATILPKYSDDDTQLEIGDEIGVFNKHGLCCGATAWQNANVAITVWGDNSQTPDTIDGFQADDTLRLRVWNKKNDVEHFTEVVFKSESLPVYKSNGFSILEKLVAKRRIPEHFHFMANTGKNASVKIPPMVKPQYSDSTLLNAGDEVGVFTKDGLCCGATVWEGIYTSIIVWSDCTATPIIDGFQVGDTLLYHVWRRNNVVFDLSTEHYASVVYKEDHPKVYLHGGISIMKSLVADLNTTTAVIESNSSAHPITFKLSQNCPNPFNPETRIEYQLPYSGEIRLCIFDIRGQLVRQLINGLTNAGSHLVVWNGKNDSGQMVASAVYFYRIEFKPNSNEYQSLVDVKKMILMK